MEPSIFSLNLLPIYLTFFHWRWAQTRICLCICWQVEKRSEMMCARWWLGNNLWCKTINTSNNNSQLMTITTYRIQRAKFMRITSSLAQPTSNQTNKLLVTRPGVWIADYWDTFNQIAWIPIIITNRILCTRVDNHSSTFAKVFALLGCCEEEREREREIGREKKIFLLFHIQLIRFVDYAMCVRENIFQWYYQTFTFF